MTPVAVVRSTPVAVVPVAPVAVVRGSSLQYRWLQWLGGWLLLAAPVAAPVDPNSRCDELWILITFKNEAL